MPTTVSTTTYGGGNVTGFVDGWATTCTIAQEIEYEDQMWGVPLTLQKRYVKMTRTTMSATIKHSGPPSTIPKGDVSPVSLTFLTTALDGTAITYSVNGYITSLNSQAGEKNISTTSITVVQYN
jgi:hypothetical protein